MYLRSVAQRARGPCTTPLPPPLIFLVARPPSRRWKGGHGVVHVPRARFNTARRYTCTSLGGLPWPTSHIAKYPSPTVPLRPPDGPKQSCARSMGARTCSLSGLLRKSSSKAYPRFALTYPFIKGARGPPGASGRRPEGLQTEIVRNMISCAIEASFVAKLTCGLYGTLEIIIVVPPPPQTPTPLTPGREEDGGNGN